MPITGASPADSTPLPARLSRTIERELYLQSRASGWDVSLETFSDRLNVSVTRRFQTEAPVPREVEAFARSLHLEDLALACACAAGHERAWEHFILELRPSLYAAARQMTSAERARELADSVFGEMFGLEARGGQRRSLLDYYHGRARLSTWLRTVMAQRHVDALRTSARSVPLDDEEGLADRVETQPLPNPRRTELVALAQRALDAAVAALDPRDRLRLRLYYGEGLKLAQNRPSGRRARSDGIPQARASPPGYPHAHRTDAATGARPQARRSHGMSRRGRGRSGAEHFTRAGG